MRLRLGLTLGLIKFMLTKAAENPFMVRWVGGWLSGWVVGLIGLRLISTQVGVEVELGNICLR